MICDTEAMQKDFDKWNTQKKRLDQEVQSHFPYEGQVWICAYGINVGSEQNGTGETFSRPVLIVKKFTADVFWAVPLSSRQKSWNIYYNFTDPNGKEAAVILAQLKLMSAKRLERKLYNLPETDLQKIKASLIQFLS